MASTPWLKKVRAFKEANGWTLAELGREAAKKAGRGAHWDKSAVSRYLNGETSPQELTSALTLLLGEGPDENLVLSEDMGRWLDFGQRLKAEAPVWFGELLQWLAGAVETLEKKTLPRE